MTQLGGHPRLLQGRLLLSRPHGMVPASTVVAFGASIAGGGRLLWSSTIFKAARNVRKASPLQAVRTFRTKRPRDPKAAAVSSVPTAAAADAALLASRGLISASAAASSALQPSLFNLLRPLVFTVGFGTCAFAGAAIWQYENMRSEAVRRIKSQSLAAKVKELWPGWAGTAPESTTPPSPGSKAGEIRQYLNDFWNGLSEGQKVFAPILAANLAVFAMWRVPSLSAFMVRYFTSNPAISVSGAPMVLSAFSHSSLIHLACNMFVLHSFCVPVVAALGKEQFVALYLTSCAVTSFFSHAVKVVRGSMRSGGRAAMMGCSLGASGAICAMLGVFATLMPDAKLQLVFLPGFTFTADSGIRGLMLVDLVGVLAGWRFFDHAAHLSGVLFGIWWCRFGHHLVWERRGPLMHWWHEKVRGSIPPIEPPKK